jgi:hypothetical protein
MAGACQVFLTTVNSKMKAQCNDLFVEFIYVVFVVILPVFKITYAEFTYEVLLRSLHIKIEHIENNHH